MSRELNNNIALAEDVRLIQRFEIDHGRVIDFSLVLRMKVSDVWHTVKRWDTATIHGSVPHSHIFTLSGKERREVIGEAVNDFSELIKVIIQDIKDRLDIILDNFRHSS